MKQFSYKRAPIAAYYSWYGGETRMSGKSAESGNNPNYKENKFLQEDSPISAEKAAKRPASLNGITKENNPR